MMELLPTIRCRRLNDISLETLKTFETKLIFLDMDNTLAPWRSDSVPEEFLPWIEKVKSEGITVVILTNSKGLLADRIGQKLNIPVYKNAKKPFTWTTKKIIKKLGFNSENVLFVGDQLFTDIQLANSLKAKSVLTEPLSSREWWCTKVFNRTREKLVWRFLFK